MKRRICDSSVGREKDEPALFAEYVRFWTLSSQMYIELTMDELYLWTESHGNYCDACSTCRHKFSEEGAQCL